MEKEEEEREDRNERRKKARGGVDGAQGLFEHAKQPLMALREEAMDMLRQATPQAAASQSVK